MHRQRLSERPMAPTDAWMEFDDALLPDAGGIEVLRDGDQISLRMWGEHDRSTVGLISTALVDAIDTDDCDVAVDLSGVSFMDCSTVGALIHGRGLLVSRDRRLTVRFPSRSQRRLLELCGLAELIESDRPGEAPGGAPAATPLETWVEVPPTERLSEGGVLPPGRHQGQDDARRARGAHR